MKNIVLFFFTLTLISSLSAQSNDDKKKKKEEKALEEYEAIKALIKTDEYTIEATWATSNKGKRINLIGNNDFLKINQKEADVDLPFFGQAYSGAGFGGDSGIKFKGTMENYNVELNDKKQRITINFNGKGKSDTYNFTLSIFTSGSASIHVTSNNRSAMKYDGKVVESKENE